MRVSDAVASLDSPNRFVALAFAAIFVALIGMLVFVVLFEDRTAECDTSAAFLHDLPNEEGTNQLGRIVFEGGSVCTGARARFLVFGDSGVEALERQFGIVGDWSSEPTGLDDDEWEVRGSWAVRAQTYNCTVHLSHAGDSASANWSGFRLSAADGELLAAGDGDLIELLAFCKP